MRGGVKFYRGSAGAARNYVEAERGRADDYYLAEGTGFAERYSATADGQVRAMPQMDGDAYEAWVSGVDPETGELRGRVRNDEHALRFAEVVVNGPKSWSIAAELHPDVAAAYEAAQDRAAAEIVRYFAQIATTRVGPRGGQVAMPVERLEAVSVRHYTSRAGDPHRHLHVQINARVEAAGKWRGIDSVAVRDAIGAVHGIGHAAVVADPAFRAALAAHGFTLDVDTGEVVELADYVEAFSKRAEQISGQVEGYEAEWRAANPDEEPGPALRRSWDARAWAEHRPGKAHLEPAEVAHTRWLDELDDLGYRSPERPAPVVPTPVGQLDRDAAVAEILARLTATRSAWNQHDVRGEAEQLLARSGVVVEAEVRRELAEDLAARAQAASVPLLDRPDTPAHIRAWTSAEAIAVEQDLTGRLAVRGAEPGHDAGAEQVDRAAAAAGARLDPTQAEATAALAGNPRPRPGHRRCRRRQNHHPGHHPRCARARRTPARRRHSHVEGRPRRRGRDRRPHRLCGLAGLPARLALGRPHRSLDPPAGRRRRRRGSTATPGRSPIASTKARDRMRSYAAVTCSSSTRPGCSTRTPPARCSPSPTNNKSASRSSATRTSSPRSAAAAYWTSPAAGPTARSLST